MAKGVIRVFSAPFLCDFPNSRHCIRIFRQVEWNHKIMSVPEPVQSGISLALAILDKFFKTEIVQIPHGTHGMTQNVYTI